MGKRGIPPRPTALKVLHGEKPYRVNQDEPKPDDAEVVPPAWLSDQALEVWHRLAPDLEAKGVLTAWDVDAFAQLCASIIVAQDALQDIAENGTNCKTIVRELSDGTLIYDLRKNPAWQIARESMGLMVSLGGRFGLNPSDRSQLTMKSQDDTGKGADRLLG